MTAVGTIYGASNAAVDGKFPQNNCVRLNNNFKALTADFAVKKMMIFDTTIDPASLADGAGATISITGCVGVVLGDFCLPSFTVDLAGITVSAYVKVAGEINIRIQNESGGGVNLASGTLSVLVFCRT